MASISALFNPTPLVNVARYSALVGGAAYGIYHRHALQKDADKAHLAAVKAHRQELVEQAKAKWAQLHPPPKASGVVSDPDSPDFDLEKFLESLDK